HEHGIHRHGGSYGRHALADNTIFLFPGPELTGPGNFFAKNLKNRIIFSIFVVKVENTLFVKGGIPYEEK
ncbi:MAG: hypothetical protein IJM41_10750, partial [Bacteroidales bacterium]|nr:hypothetical protein [Bacteroidales bacterium]